jgi:hypothetical protein
MVEEYTKATRQVAEKREVLPVNCAAYRRQQRQEMAAEVGEYHWN